MNNTDPEGQREELVRWIALTRSHLQAIDDQLGPLLEEQQVGRERLRLLEQLLVTYDREQGEGVERSSTSSMDVGTMQLEEAAIQLLREAGRPLHVSQIRRELVKRGVTIPGQGLDANVIARLARCSDFVRVARGTYTLMER